MNTERRKLFSSVVYVNYNIVFPFSCDFDTITYFSIYLNLIYEVLSLLFEPYYCLIPIFILGGSAVVGQVKRSRNYSRRIYMRYGESIYTERVTDYSAPYFVFYTIDS